VSLSQCCSCLSCVPGEVLAVLAPHLAGTVIEGGREDGGRVWLLVRPAAAEAACPRCGVLSGRVHSGYSRRLRDVPAGGREVVIWLAVRRLFCGNAACGAVTFAEQVQGLASRYSRRTPPLAAALAAIAVALCGRAGARLAAALGMPAGRDSMIRLVMAIPERELTAAPEILGVDDFALRKGRVYGTVLIDVESGDVIDVLPDREAATVEDWLKAHPGAAVICRDRAGAYAEAARGGAPDAVQVADRWHLWHNLRDHARDAAARHRDCLREPPPGQPAACRPPDHDHDHDRDRDREQDQGREPGDLEAVIRERHAAVHQLLGQGSDPARIAAALGLAEGTAGRFCRAATAGALLAAARPAPGLDPFKPRLRQLHDQGCTSIAALHAAITALGYAGSYSTTYGYASLFRLAAPPKPPAPPAPRQAAGWITAPPAALNPAEAAALAAIRARCPALDTLAGHVTAFAEILTGRHGGTRLDDWLTAASASPGQPELRSFASGIHRDYHAVRNGLTLPWSSGKVEGTVNKIKLIKRQAYGRAGFPLLRKRILLA
jgi:transposase